MDGQCGFIGLASACLAFSPTSWCVHTVLLLLFGGRERSLCGPKTLCSPSLTLTTGQLGGSVVTVVSTLLSPQM